MMKFFRQQASQPAAKPGEKPAAPRRMGPPKFTPEQQAEIDKYKEEVKAWRLGLDLSKVEGARKLLNEAGISAHIVKMEPSRMGSDEEIDYAFKVAKAMGAKAVTDEINLETAKRVAPFAEKHGMYMAFHNHMQYAEEGFSCDPILAVSPSIMLNFDAGHFFGSTGIHPNEMIKKYHDRIYSIHLKDKTGPTTGDQPNTNQVWHAERADHRHRDRGRGSGQAVRGDAELLRSYADRNGGIRRCRDRHAWHEAVYRHLRQQRQVCADRQLCRHLFRDSHQERGILVHGLCVGVDLRRQLHRNGEVLHPR